MADGWMAGWLAGLTVIIMLLSPAGAWAWAELGKMKNDLCAMKRILYDMGP